MAPSPPARKISRRACDGCKIRKIKCVREGELPCAACTTVGLSCTFHKHQLTRGPRSLRAKTIQQISVTQEATLDDVGEPDEQNGDHGIEGPHGDGLGSTPPGPDASDTGRTPRPARPPLGSCTSTIRHVRGTPSSSFEPSLTPMPSLVLRLCTYRLRLFPVWPIIAVEEIMAALHRDTQDMASYALANAVGAATIAQLKLERNADQDPVTAAMMEAECQRARSLLHSDDQEPSMTLDSLRISFFLHVYHENKCPGGSRSLLYLREAITTAQIIGLHKESTYFPLPPREQQMRQRILWLLFVTERGVAMLHKLPVVLKCNIRFLNLDDAEDDAHVLPAFKKLVHLFWLIDQSGAFDSLQRSDDVQCMQQSAPGSIEAWSRNRLDVLQKQLREVSMASGYDNDVQAADLCVTCQWMQAILWRAWMKQQKTRLPSQQATVLSHPIQIAREFLETISRLPSSAMESHGAAMEYKIYEIARAVTDSVINGAIVVRTPTNSDRSHEILNQLQKKLASCRGGNKTLLSLLRTHIAETQNSARIMHTVTPTMRVAVLGDRGRDREERPLFSRSPRSQAESEAGRRINRRAPNGTRYMTAQSPNLQELIQQVLPADPDSNSDIRMQDTLEVLPQGRVSWNTNIQGTNSHILPHDLYNQLQNFDGSFSGGDPSAAMDIFTNGASIWDTPGSWEMPGTGGPPAADF